MKHRKRGLRAAIGSEQAATTRADYELRRVMRELQGTDQISSNTDPIVEQLKKCPEAFHAGEMVGKMFDAVKYGQHPPAGGHRHLPPAGIVLPLV
jgi:hypothetical protein